MAEVIQSGQIGAPLSSSTENLKTLLGEQQLQGNDKSSVKDIVRYPGYSDVRTRRDTFNGTWPRGMRQTADACADAGFFYIDSGDKVVCFHCGIGIKDWVDSDIPWEEHVNWSPNCGFLLKKKGIDFIENVQECRKTCQKDGPIPILTCKHAPFIIYQDAQKLPKIINAETVQSPSSIRTGPTVCKRCNMRISNVAFLPCGHVNTCKVCSPLVHKCPTCNNPRTGVVRIYYA